MKSNTVFSASLASIFFIAAAVGQSGPSPVAAPAGQSGQNRPSIQSAEPVSYASVSQLNGVLSQLEATAKNTQADLTRLRIERWKTDGATKKQALSNVDSIQRNLQGALPEIIAKLRSTPENVPDTFKLYRNLDALYDVLGSVVEGAGAFGSKDDLQALSNDLNAFEGTRRQLGERIDNLATSKEAEIARLRTDLRTAQAQIPATPPKKTVIDDTEPPKKPAAKKKPAPAKKSITPDTTKPAAGQTQNPPAQQPQTKPQ